MPAHTQQQFGVFTLEQALSSGWSRSAVNRAVNSGRLLRIRRGAFAEPVMNLSSWQAARARLLMKAAAAGLCVPSATISHAAAIVAHGLPLYPCVPEVPCLTFRPGFRVAVPGIHLHRSAIPGWQLSRHDVAVTSIARTIFDLSRESGPASAVVAADAAAHRGTLCRDDLERVRRTMRGRRGAPHSRLIIDLMDSRSESPLETLSRLELRDFDPAPEPQVDLWARDGRHLARVDFYWHELGVVGEADGREKYNGDESVLWQEKRRQDRLTELGLVLARWTWADVIEPSRLREKIMRAMYQAHLLRSAGVLPRVLERCERPRSG